MIDPEKANTVSAETWLTGLGRVNTVEQDKLPRRQAWEETTTTLGHQVVETYGVRPNAGDNLKTKGRVQELRVVLDYDSLFGYERPFCLLKDLAEIGLL